MRGLKIYEIDSRYIKFLSGFQEHIFSTEGEKGGRKYIGIILEINGFKYFAPLSSFKAKHKKMNEGVDFIKIKDYSVININNEFLDSDSAESIGGNGSGGGMGCCHSGSLRKWT